MLQRICIEKKVDKHFRLSIRTITAIITIQMETHSVNVNTTHSVNVNASCKVCR